MNKCFYCGEETGNKKYCSNLCCNKDRAMKGAEKLYGKKIEYKVICHICKKEFSVFEFEKLHPKKERYYCGKICSNKNSPETIKKIKESLKNKRDSGWKMSDETKEKISISIKKCNRKPVIHSESNIEKIRIRTIEFNKNYWTEEKKKEHSLLMSKIVKEKPDSYSKNNVSGRAKIIEYNGRKLKGKWELQIAELLDKYKIDWTNDIKPIPYFWNNNWHLYFPDFYLTKQNKFIEVKGYERERDRKKWENVHNLIVIKEIEIEILKKNGEKILEYVN